MIIQPKNPKNAPKIICYLCSVYYELNVYDRRAKGKPVILPAERHLQQQCTIAKCKHVLRFHCEKFDPFFLTKMPVITRCMVPGGPVAPPAEQLARAPQRIAIVGGGPAGLSLAIGLPRHPPRTASEVLFLPHFQCRIGLDLLVVKANTVMVASSSNQ